MAKIILTDAIINEMSIREINRHFRNEDESDKWPICGSGLEYYLALEDEIGRIVNDERNW